VHYQHHGIWFARHGYVALLIDTIEFGEVPGLHHGTHDLGMWYWHSLGYSPAGPEVWNAIRAADYLETRPEVDAKRLAITGISGGGAITWFAAAADERFQAAAAVCGTWTVGQHAKLDAVKENCDCIYFVNAFQYDLPTVGALIAPRPFKMLSWGGAMSGGFTSGSGIGGVFGITSCGGSGRAGPAAGGAGGV
jgi:dienelactone hydrolase